MGTIDLGLVIGARKGGDADTLGGKPPEYYIQPMNLLDNSDFRNPVNQRGKETIVSKNGYFIDRWTTYSEGATYSITHDGLTIDATSLSSAGTISQYIPKLKDGNYTAAMYDTSGNVFGVRRYTVADGKCTLQGSELNGGLVVLWYSQSSGINVFELRCEAGNTVTYSKAALYEGSHTADTLPSYTPKGYVAELTACQVAEHGVPVCSGQVVNNFTTIQEGFVADARTVKMLNDGLGLRLKYARIMYEGMTFAPGSKAIVPTTIPEGAPESGTVIAVILYAQYDNVYYQWNPQDLGGGRNVNVYSFSVNNLRGASFVTNVRGLVLYRD